jgi:hypothetical protein
MEKTPYYIITSGEHKFQALCDGLTPYGVDVGWIKAPAHSREPDHEKDLARAAELKLKMFARMIGRAEIIKQIPESVDLWRLLIMDVAGSINLSKETHTLTTCRNQVVVGEKINGTAKLLCKSPVVGEGFREVSWAHTTAYGLQGRTKRLQGVGSLVSEASLLVSDSLAVAMEKNRWQERVKLDQKYNPRGEVAVINSRASGGLDWTKLQLVLDHDQELIWQCEGKKFHARGKEIEPGMMESMNFFLRGCPHTTLSLLANLT